ncbi:hypothetical protein Poli38472_003470 [Pythium oligandrum]|uniref:Uncharacterized protein n=1 Tax=Pythium oligandrum TaxID=41045 RepID=A0A8K1C750_PYTOL|nr:hypothetical protein Poli38472_003470 [Pythium oligandrum]|eukprot:TMW57545.1 hypothetical protein Poli38472_003470 [Pythium oligandrum]
MWDDISTIGGAIATAATAVAAGVTFGQVEALNDSVVKCANFTAKNAEQSLTRHVGETVGAGDATAATAVAAGVTFGQVDALNDAVVACAEATAKSGAIVGKEALTLVDGITDSVPVVGHVKGGVMYALGENERGDRAMKGASRTVGVVAGGVGGFVVGGPVGAVVGGVSGGAAMDGLTTGVDSAVHGEFRPNGQIACWAEVAKGEDAGQVARGVIGGILTPVMDGLGGYSAGRGFAKIQPARNAVVAEEANQPSSVLGPRNLIRPPRATPKRKTDKSEDDCEPLNPALDQAKDEDEDAADPSTNNAVLSPEHSELLTMEARAASLTTT